MKKYIRTEDGIWLFGGTHHKGDVIIGKKQEIDFGYCFDKKDIVKQADTIEELCDEFVDVNSLCCSLLNEKEKQDIKRFAKSNLYGAIWTSKGLIYVAKMNDKGEFELL